MALKSSPRRTGHGYAGAMVIVSCVANALIADVHTWIENPILGAFRRLYGGLWVGGRLTVTTTELEFHANAANRALQSGQLDIRADLRAVSSVEVLPGVVIKIIAIHTDEQVIKVRCWRARNIADRIRAAAADAHAAG